MFTDSLTKKIRIYDELFAKTITNEKCKCEVKTNSCDQSSLYYPMKHQSNELLDILKEIINDKVFLLSQDYDTNREKSIYNAAILLIKGLHRTLSDSGIMSATNGYRNVNLYYTQVWVKRDDNDWLSKNTWKAITKKYLEKNFVDALTKIFQQHRKFCMEDKHVNSCLFYSICPNLKYPNNKLLDNLNDTFTNLGFETEESLFVITPQTKTEFTAYN